MSDNSKTIAIVSYIPIIGWIIAVILNSNKKSKLGSFHIRQTLLIYIAAIIFSWLKYIGWIFEIILFVFWFIGLLSAINGEQKEIPIIGPLAQKWFKGL